MRFFDRWRRLPDDVAGDAEPRDPELAQLLARARALPSESEPARDLWSGIENRVAGRVQEAPAPRGGAAWGSVFPRPGLAAAFGSALVVATSLVTLWLAVPSGPVGEVVAAQTLADRARTADGVSDVRVRLLAVLERGRDELPPATLASLEQNLAAIDAAIGEIHLAFETNPNDHTLRYLLADAYRREAELLEDLEWWLGKPEEASS